MKQNKTSVVWGAFLILVGVVLLIGNFCDLHMEELWPIFLIAGGIAFFVGYILNRNHYGLLMPGSILTVIGLLFQYCSLKGWYHMENLWPVFILAPAVGFIAMYYGGIREKGLLIPAGILSAIGLLFLFFSMDLGELWPVLLIVGGIILIGWDLVSKKRIPSTTKKK